MTETKKREKNRNFNIKLLSSLGFLLNNRPDYITSEIISELREECGMEESEAVGAVLAAAIGLDVADDDEDFELYRAYFPQMLKKLSPDEFSSDPYYRNIRVPERKFGRWTLSHDHFEPYELFVRDDLRSLPDGRIIPQLGFFGERFEYPTVLEDGREWMTITPNEIITMREAVAAAAGRVLTYGLGLGYYAYMAAIRDEVSEVTVVERDPEIIDMFERFILPQFGEVGKKLRIVRSDAFEFASAILPGQYELIFTDLWHDPNDGVILRERMRDLEKNSPGSRYIYWISDTLDCYEAVPGVGVRLRA